MTMIIMNDKDDKNDKYNKVVNDNINKDNFVFYICKSYVWLQILDFVITFL